MQKKLNSFVFFSLLLLVANAAFGYQIPERPNPPRLVNDLAQVLSFEQETALESKLVRYNDSTSTQITVAILPTLEDGNIAEYAFKLGRIWGVGQKGKDNGIVILICPEARQSFIATGYGIEGFVTDMAAGEIVRQEMIPFFKEGKYYEGIDAGVDNLFLRLTGAYKADASNSSDGIPTWLIILLVLILVMIIIKSMGGGGSGITYTPHGTRTHWGSTPFMGGGWGSSGGGFGGGSSGGGGFGGFGGGSFGGGGAGGSW